MKARAAARTEQGTVTIFMAVLALGLLFAAGLALDGGRKLGALSEARDLADNAARVGAQQIDRDAWRLTGVPNIDPGAASAEANAYLAATGHQGAVSVAGDTVTVTVTITIPAAILFGSMTVSATESATAEASVTGAP
jgi:Flp pilus assembly protein TadG